MKTNLAAILAVWAGACTLQAGGGVSWTISTGRSPAWCAPRPCPPPAFPVCRPWVVYSYPVYGGWYSWNSVQPSGGFRTISVAGSPSPGPAVYQVPPPVLKPELPEVNPATAFRWKR